MAAKRAMQAITQKGIVIASTMSNGRHNTIRDIDRRLTISLPLSRLGIALTSLAMLSLLHRFGIRFIDFVFACHDSAIQTSLAALAAPGIYLSTSILISQSVPPPKME